MILRMDPFTAIIFSMFFVGLINIVAVDSAKDMEAGQKTKSSLCMMCLETETETNVSSDVEVKVDVM